MKASSATSMPTAAMLSKCGHCGTSKQNCES